MRSAPLALLLAASLVACDPAEPSSDVNQDRIYARYELIYDGTNDRTEPRASFRFGNATGTQLRLDMGAEVRFDGEPLDLQTPLNITFYNTALDGLVSSGTFTYVDGDGDAFRNEVRLRPIALPSALPEIDNDRSYTVAWDGAPVGDGDEVQLVLYRVSVDSRLAAASAVERGATSVTVPASQLRDVQPGEITVLLRRFTRADAEEAPSAGGETVGEYNAPQALVRVVD